jgi:hypothetical protein
MNERIRQLYQQAHEPQPPTRGTGTLTKDILWEQPDKFNPEKFAKLLIEDVLDEVKERAYYTGDRDWSDDVDRQWIQLEFGYGPLHDAKQGIFK